MSKDDLSNPRISRRWRCPGDAADLANLSNLDEQTILNELKARYQTDSIYVSMLSFHITHQTKYKLDKLWYLTIVSSSCEL